MKESDRVAVMAEVVIEADRKWEETVNIGREPDLYGIPRQVLLACGWSEGRRRERCIARTQLKSNCSK